MASFGQKSGVFVVRYDTSEALSPERQRDLEGALRAAARERPVGISASNLLKNTAVTVKPFTDEAMALAWVSGVVAGSA